MAFTDSATVRAEDVLPGALDPGVQLADGSVGPTKLSADAIDGKTITGALIRTAATGKRTALNSAAVPNGIAYYTGDPAETAPGLLQPDIQSPGVFSVMIQSPRSGSGAVSYYRLSSDGTAAGGVAEIGANSLGLLVDTLTIVGAIEVATNETWHNLTLANGWAALGGLTPQYRKDLSGNVFVIGRVSAGTTGVVATLPVGYRPKQLLDIQLKSNNDASTSSWVQINTTGTINVVGNVAAAQTWLALNFSFSSQAV